MTATALVGVAYVRDTVRPLLDRLGGRDRALLEARHQADLAEESLMYGDESGAELHIRRALHLLEARP